MPAAMTPALQLFAETRNMAAGFYLSVVYTLSMESKNYLGLHHAPDLDAMAQSGYSNGFPRSFLLTPKSPLSILRWIVAGAAEHLGFDLQTSFTSIQARVSLITTNQTELWSRFESQLLGLWHPQRIISHLGRMTPPYEHWLSTLQKLITGEIHRPEAAHWRYSLMIHELPWTRVSKSLRWWRFTAIWL